MAVSEVEPEKVRVGRRVELIAVAAVTGGSMGAGQRIAFCAVLMEPPGDSAFRDAE
jgi:hypothetical protein